MKLHLAKEWPAIAAPFAVLHTAVLDDGTLIALVESRTCGYNLLQLHPDSPRIHLRPLPHVRPDDREDRPVLLTRGMAWALLDGRDDLHLHADPEAEALHVRIADPHQVYPPHARKHAASVAATAGSPAFVCVERAPAYLGQARHFAELRWRVDERSAQWRGLASLQPSADCPASAQGLSPRVGHLASAADGGLYAFVPGSQSVAAEKWGMDYWALARIDRAGRVERVLMRGGDTGDGRKRGVRAAFMACAGYLLLSPMFAGDEWRGRQRLFSISDGTLEEVAMPRGRSAYRLLQHRQSRFWICRQDAGRLSLALCRGEP